MLDSSNSYNELLESKKCTNKVLISHDSYDKFKHSNTVNSFYKLIEEKLQKYITTMLFLSCEEKRKVWII